MNTTLNTNTLVAAARFHTLASTAARNGGFWVSAAGGTANVVAGVISRATGASFADAHHALDVTGGDDWYSSLAHAQPWAVFEWHDEVPGRWDARTIARAACRPVKAEVDRHYGEQVESNLKREYAR